MTGAASGAACVHRYTDRHTLDQLHHNLVEVVTLVLEDQDPQPETEFVGTHTAHV